MATVMFTEDSPYKSSLRREHHTDYKYVRFLEDTGVTDKQSTELPKKIGKMNVALFGLGRAGTFHLSNILMNRKLNLLYVVEKKSERKRRYKEEFNLDHETLLSDDEEDKVFQDPRVHGVIIATPTFTHENLVTKGLRAKKPVFCEKPVSQNIEGTSRCYALAEEMKTPLFCAFNRRFDPGFEEVYNQVRGGKIGRVHLIKTVARDSPLPSLDYLKISGGIFHDCAVHDIDLICWILGEYPIEAFAVASAFIPEIGRLNDYDTVAITLKFESGTIGMIDLSRNAVYGYDQTLEVFGPKGKIAAANESPMQVFVSNLEGQSQPPIYHSFPSRYQEGYRRELSTFCDMMQGKKTENISGENTLKISKIAEALHQSVKKGQLIKIQY